MYDGGGTKFHHRSLTARTELQKLASLVADAFEAQLQKRPELREVRAIVMLTSNETAGACLSNYEDEDRAHADLIVHLESMLAHRGMKLTVTHK
jgi:hypothetical protein